jgi:hypothetical protein
MTEVKVPSGLAMTLLYASRRPGISVATAGALAGFGVVLVPTPPFGTAPPPDVQSRMGATGRRRTSGTLFASGASERVLDGADAAPLTGLQDDERTVRSPTDSATRARRLDRLLATKILPTPTRTRTDE